MTETFVWRIRNKATGAYLTGSHSKTTWAGAGHAKNAWKAWMWRRYGRTRDIPKFAEQDEWECVKFRLVEVGESKLFPSIRRKTAEETLLRLRDGRQVGDFEAGVLADSVLYLMAELDKAKGKS